MLSHRRSPSYLSKATLQEQEKSSTGRYLLLIVRSEAIIIVQSYSRARKRVLACKKEILNVILKKDFLIG